MHEMILNSQNARGRSQICRKSASWQRSVRAPRARLAMGRCKRQHARNESMTKNLKQGQRLEINSATKRTCKYGEMICAAAWLAVVTTSVVSMPAKS
jgi:hypothetical protein